MIERLVPSRVAVSQTRQELVEVELFPEELRAMGRPVEKRRREFVTGRACARHALARLGVGAVAIPSGPGGEPVWPAGVVGSLTHCPGFCACAVGRAEDVVSLGIDAEVNEPLPDGVLEQVAFGRERAMVAARSAPVCLDRLLFGAKEAIYKAWFPLTERWLGFEDVQLTIDVAAQTFRARLLVTGPMVGSVPLTEFSGRWCTEDGIVAVACLVMPRTDGANVRR